ncbi:MAG: hypothetical protein KZY74_01880 [Paenibacillaceae bacterium]|uniref:SHOCT domain-containing protein n=1 Tax=Paenibacillus mellifer TaxID=2937794 RepID=A0A9X1XX92_9BACL|nr:hypothetical protein [Paenibacillus mellifer]MBW4838119.1 hypothetical protein [Paenibacillaceae bacterium]MCK8487260.1 hypothetical protein [Paenibacillus mellifer]
MKFKLKKVVILGTMALVITINPSMSGYLTSLAYAAHPSKQSSTSNHAEHPEDELNGLLGAASDKEVYDALLEGESLADIAESHGQDADPVIRLQVAQLQEQLQKRLKEGSLTQEAYELQLQELPEIVADSARTRYTILG